MPSTRVVPRWTSEMVGTLQAFHTLCHGGSVDARMQPLYFLVTAGDSGINSTSYEVHKRKGSVRHNFGAFFAGHD